MKTILAFLTFIVLCHVSTGNAAALFGTVDAVSGSAVVSDQSGSSSSISTGQEIYEGQTISTESDGEVHVATADGGIIAVRPNTVFRVHQYQADGDDSADRIFMSLFKGAVRSITGWIGKHNMDAYRITTPTATIGVRGTDHETTVIEGEDGDEPGTYDTVNEGATVLKTPHGSSEVGPGKFAFAPKGRAVAPFFLARQPNFWAKRRLKIEERIVQRKAFFRERMEQMRGERIQRLQEIRYHRMHQASEKRGGEHKPEGLAEKRNEIREQRLNEARERREERRHAVNQSEHPRQERRREMREHSGEERKAPHHRDEQKK